MTNKRYADECSRLLILTYHEIVNCLLYLSSYEATLKDRDFADFEDHFREVRNDFDLLAEQIDELLRSKRY